MKFSNFLNLVFIKWRVCLLFLVLTSICFGYLVPNAQKPIFTHCTDSAITKVLDEKIMTWTPDYAKHFYQVIGPEGRKEYRLFFLKLDFWFPSLTASLFYISLLSYAFPIGSKFSKLNLLPILGWLMDVFENINHFTMATTYPNLPSFSLTFGPVFTFAKWFFVLAIPIIAIIGFSIRISTRHLKTK